MPTEKKIAMIVAASEDNVIGVDGDLPWQLSADLKRFKQLTMGHHMIMGRKTFESIGRLLPGRTTVIVTRQQDFEFAGAKVAHSIQQAIDVCEGDDCVFVIGGAEIYQLVLPIVTEIHLTRVHAKVVGDTELPEIDWGQWSLVECVRHQADVKNSVDYSFATYHRKE